MIDLSESFWDNRYRTQNIGWDLGKVSLPLKIYFDQLTDKSIKILIPGGGNSYEAEYLHAKGFSNVYVVDMSSTALQNIKNRVPAFSEKHLIHQDFFNLKLTFDLVVEQTFFCALNPKLRNQYAKKMSEIISENGKLVGVLFGVPLNTEHPPFGGDKSEYLNYFKPYFSVELIEDCYNSEISRKGKELFIKFIKRSL